MSKNEFTSFITEFNKFQGRMDEFKSNTERRLNEYGVKLSTIEKDVSTVCMDHEAIAVMFAQVKENQNKQQETNIKQEGKNMDTNNWQGRQDKSIQNLENKTDFIEYKISTKDMAKIVTALAAVLVPTVSLIIFILDKVLGL